MKKLFMKLWRKVLNFWYFTIKNRRENRFEAGGFVIDFHQYDLRIRTMSGNFSMKIRAGEYSFGYLAASVGQGRADNVHGYALFLYVIATSICKDDKLRKEVQKAIERYQKRVEALASVKEDEREDELSIAAEQGDEERAKMSRAQRRRAERQTRKMAKKILKENKDEQE